MNGEMAKRARLIFLGLVVKAGKRGSGRAGRRGMALETEQIDLAAFQKTRIGRAVRGVTGSAPLRPHDRMFHGKRPRLAGMAFEADGIAGRAGSNLPRIESTMGVVAVAATDHAFIYTMVEGPGEIRLHAEVALEAQRRLRSFQHGLFNRSLVNGMAIETADAILPVRRAQEIDLLFPKRVAG